MEKLLSHSHRSTSIFLRSTSKFGRSITVFVSSLL